MNEVDNINTTPLCRTCIYAKKSKYLRPLTEKLNLHGHSSSAEDSLVNILQNCVPGLIIDLTLAQMPLEICAECIEQLQGVLEFQSKCLQSQQQLRHLLQQQSSSAEEPAAKADPLFEHFVNDINTEIVVATHLNFEQNIIRSEHNDDTSPETETFANANIQFNAEDDNLPLSLLKLTYSNEQQADMNNSIENAAKFKSTDSVSCTKPFMARSKRCHRQIEKRIQLNKLLKRHNFAEIFNKEMLNIKENDNITNQDLGTLSHNEELVIMLDNKSKKHESEDIQDTNTDELNIDKDLSYAVDQSIQDPIDCVDMPSIEEIKPDYSKNISCSFCHTKFTALHSLKRHLKSHCKLKVSGDSVTEMTATETQPAALQCDKCCKTFSSKISLQLHHRFHLYLSLDKKFSCDRCGNRFARRCYLSRHRRKCRRNVRALLKENKGFECDECGRKFRKEFYIKDHKKRMHENPKHQIAKADKLITEQSVNANDDNTTKQDLGNLSLNEEFVIMLDNKSEKHESEGIQETNDELNDELKDELNIDKDLSYAGDQSIQDPIDCVNEIKPNFSKNISCSFCHTEFTALRSLTRHLKTRCKLKGSSGSVTEITATETQPALQCDKCCKTFNSSSSLQLHYRFQHKKRMHENPKQQTAKTDKLTEQSVNSNDEVVQQLSEQDVDSADDFDSYFDVKQEGSKAEANKLKKKYVYPKSYFCHICNEEVKLFRDLKHHMEQNHPEAVLNTKPQPPFKCDICSKELRTRRTLRQHLNLHKKEPQFLCPECGKILSTAGGLKDHLNRHKGLNILKCGMCPKMFPCLSDLSKHRQNHSQEREHICDICGSAFKLGTTLSKHKKTHLKTKNFQCEFCNVRFHNNDQLQRHRRTHTGEKPYKCKYCDRAFIQSNDMVKHMRSHVGDCVYQCDLCPEAFRLVRELRAHFEQHVNDDEETRQRNLKALQEKKTPLGLAMPRHGAKVVK